MSFKQHVYRIWGMFQDYVGVVLELFFFFFWDGGWNSWLQVLGGGQWKIHPRVDIDEQGSLVASKMIDLFHQLEGFC